MNEVLPFAELNAVVTGCAGGIGRAISKSLVDAGARVFGIDLIDHSVGAAWGQAIGGEFHPVDVTNEDAWTEFADDLARMVPRLDILVHNAGVIMLKPIEEMTLTDWHEIMSINVDGLFLGTRALLPLLREGGAHRRYGAAMITVSSTAGFNGGPFSVGYSTSKGAARLFAKGCAMEFSARNFNIRSLSIHPGITRTGLVDRMLDRFTEIGTANSVAEVEAAYQATIPMGRFAMPEEIARVVRFLASDDASYMHGSEVIVDGGSLAR